MEFSNNLIDWDKFIKWYCSRVSNELFNNNIFIKTKLVNNINDDYYILVSSEDHLPLIEAMKDEIINEFKLFTKNNKANLSFISEYKNNKEKINLINEIDANITLDNYVIGNFNRNAIKLTLEVADNCSSNYSPIFIYSKTGLGKTHLLNAISNQFIKNWSNKKLRYVNAQTFLKEIFEIFEEKNSTSLIEEFKNLYSNFDVLIIDDIQYLSDKKKTNEILFTIFNNLILKKKIIIISSDRAPHELNGFEDRMISRFSSGISCKINEPEDDSLKMIIKNILVNKNIDLTSDAINVITNVFNKDIRELIGVLNKIIFLNPINQTNNKVLLDSSNVQNILEIDNYIIGNNKKLTILRPNTIIDKVAKIYNVKPNDIISNSRKQNITIARHVTMYIMREYGKYQLKEIGYTLGNRDHTTVLNGVEKIKSQMLQDKEFNKLISSIVKKLGN